ncbi:hypothetical protein CerSpe_176090 [Prunus speciosa]
MHAFTFFILFFTSIFLETQASNENCATMCTHGTPHIQFPFHVRGQQPDHGGDPIYELDCNNTTKTTTIHFPSYGDLVVKSISYDMKRLDLLDPKSCVHEVFLNLNLSLTPFQYYYVVREYSYLNCSVRLSPSFFSEIPCLSGSDYHVYTVPPFLAVPNSCRVVKTVPIPLGYSPYLSDNSFGLGLTWGSVGDGQEETESFTMAPVKAICIILIFAAAVLRKLKRQQHFIEGEDQVQVEKLSGDYKLLKVETCCNSDLKQGNSQGETVLDI